MFPEMKSFQEFLSTDFFFLSPPHALTVNTFLSKHSFTLEWGVKVEIKAWGRFLPSVNLQL